MASVEKPLTLLDAVRECFRDREFCAQYKRLTGRDIEAATAARDSEGMNHFLEFVNETVWLRLN